MPIMLYDYDDDSGNARAKNVRCAAWGHAAWPGFLTNGWVYRKSGLWQSRAHTGQDRNHAQEEEATACNTLFAVLPSRAGAALLG